MELNVMRERKHPTDDVHVVLGLEDGVGAYMRFRGTPARTLQFLVEIMQELEKGALLEGNYLDMTKNDV